MNFRKILNLFPHKIAYAHCDIPCGIYDIHNAQLAAHTVFRMTQMLNDVKEGDIKSNHEIARLTRVKEKHSDLIEEELTTLEDDYFKNDFSKYPELEKLFKSASVLGAKARVEIDQESARELLENIMMIAELFYKSKNIKSKRVKAPYPTGMNIVVQA